MLIQKIETSDAQLVKLLVSRSLTDRGIHIDAASIRIGTVEATSGTRQIRFTYPLRKLRIAVTSDVAELEAAPLARLLEVADEQATTLEQVARDRDNLETLIMEVKSTASREIARMRRRGLGVALLDVRPSVVAAGGGWLPSPELGIEMLSASLLPKRFSFVAERPQDVLDYFADERLILEQTVRSVRKGWFEEAGAAGAIDGVIVAALSEAGMDPVSTIRRMRAEDQALVIEANRRKITLVWRDGLMSGSFAVDEQTGYERDRVTLALPLDRRTLTNLQGLPAAEILENPLFEGFRIASATKAGGQTKIALLPRYHVFDADTCQPQDRLFPM